MVRRTIEAGRIAVLANSRPSCMTATDRRCRRPPADRASSPVSPGSLGAQRRYDLLARSIRCGRISAHRARLTGSSSMMIPVAAARARARGCAVSAWPARRAVWDGGAPDREAGQSQTPRSYRRAARAIEAEADMPSTVRSDRASLPANMPTWRRSEGRARPPPRRCAIDPIFRIGGIEAGDSRSSVVLPQPEGPSSATISPDGHRKIDTNKPCITARPRRALAQPGDADALIAPPLVRPGFS